MPEIPKTVNYTVHLNIDDRTSHNSWEKGHVFFYGSRGQITAILSASVTVELHRHTKDTRCIDTLRDQGPAEDVAVGHSAEDADRALIGETRFGNGEHAPSSTGHRASFNRCGARWGLAPQAKLLHGLSTRGYGADNPLRFADDDPEHTRKLADTAGRQRVIRLRS